MAYNTRLEEKIDSVIARWKDMQKKKMFGGVAYLLKGNMCVGIWKDFLVVRMDKERAAQRMKLKDVRPFDITGKTMAGWVMVEEASWNSSAGLTAWLTIAKAFASALPQKKKRAKKRSLREYQR